MLVDRLGAKKVLFCGLLFSSLGIFFLGLAPNYAFLLLCSFLIGVGQSTVHPADYAIMASLTNVSQEGKVFGIHSFVGMIGWAVASLSITLLHLALGWNTGLLPVGLCGVGSSLVIYPLLPQTPSSSSTVQESKASFSRSPFFQGSFLLLFSYITLIAMANSGIRTFFHSLSFKSTFFQGSRSEYDFNHLLCWYRHRDVVWRRVSRSISF